MAQRRPRILHVTEALASGIVSALTSYVTHSPFADHALLAAVRPDAPMVLEEGLFCQRETLPRAYWPAIKAVRRFVAAYQPDRIHLHSSFAGLYGRLAGLPAPKVIYSPHAFAFERRDISPLKRASYYLTEQLLSFRAAYFAGVSGREVELAQTMPGFKNLVLLPNFALLPPDIPPRPHRLYPQHPGLQVVMAGRLCRQKDPDFFLGVVRMARQRADTFHFTWIGGGDAENEQRLRDAGVTVTGWQNRDYGLKVMAQADIYMHTAAWEGNPMTVLEAAELGLPIIARAIPSLRSMHLHALARTPPGLFRLLERLSNDPAYWQTLLQQSATLRQTFSAQAQKKALETLYQRP